MDAGARPPLDPNSCPDCNARLTPGRPMCPACGLSLVGPAAVRLWQVSQQMAQLAALREGLLESLRPAAPQLPAGPPPPTPTPTPATTAPVAPAPAAAARPAPVAAPAPPFPGYGDAWRAPGARSPAAQSTFGPPGHARPPRPRREWTAKRVQNLLLTLGVLLLVVAAIIFVAVAWGRLGAGGRAAVLGAVTLLAAYGAELVRRRELTATAEALALLAVLLAVLDAYGLRRFDLFGLGAPSWSTYWAGAFAVIAALSATYAAAVPLRAPRWASVIGAQLPVPILVFGAHVSHQVEAASLAAQSAAVLLVGVALTQRRMLDCVRILETGAVLALVPAFGLATHAAFETAPAGGALALVGVAAVLVLATWIYRALPTVRVGTSGAAAGVLIVAGMAGAVDKLAEPQLPLALAALGLLAVLCALSLPRVFAAGPISIGATSVGLAVLAVSPHVFTALAGPFTWLADPWQVSSLDGSARELLSPEFAWTGTVVVLAVLIVAITATVLVSEWLSNRQAAAVPIAVAAALTVLLVPLGQAWSYGPAVGWDVVVGTLLASAAVPARRRRPHLALPLYSAGLAVLAVALAWSLAAPDATVLALGAAAVVLTVLAAVDAPTRAISAALASAAVCGDVLALSARAGAPWDRTGFLVAVSAVVCIAAGIVLSGRDRITGGAIATVGLAAYVLGTTLAAGDAGWLGWTTAVGAAAAAALAVAAGEDRPDNPGRPIYAALVPALATTSLISSGMSLDWSMPRIGFLVGVLDLVLVLLAHQVAQRDTETGLGLGAIAVLGYGTAVALAGPDLGWLGWTAWSGAATSAVLLLAGGRVAGMLRAGYGVALPALVSLGTGATALAADVTEVRVGAYLCGVNLLLVTVASIAATRERNVGVAMGATAGLGYAVGLSIAAPDRGWLAWGLLAGALVAAALAVAARPARPDHALRAAYAATAATLGCGWAAALADSRGTPMDRAGFVLAVAAGVCVFAGAALRTSPTVGAALEVVGATVYVLALLATAGNLGWLSWTLALGGIVALAEALRPDRRNAAWVGGLLLSGCSWTRLAIESVTAPEAYAAPITVTALALGHMRRKRMPETSSWAAYGGGLVMGLGPSLIVAVSDPGLARPLLLAVVSLLVVLFGASQRLQAPLVLGGATLAVDAVVQVAPYAAALPRWVAFAVMGALLIAVGATFEQRRRDLQRLRDQFDALA